MKLDGSSPRPSRNQGSQDFGLKSCLNVGASGHLRVLVLELPAAALAAMHKASA